MKTSILFLLTFIFCLQIQAQTKQETIDWLNQKFIEYKDDLNIVQVVLMNQDKEDEYLAFLNLYGSFAYSYQVTPLDIKSIKMEKAPYGNYNFILFSSKALEEVLFDRINGNLTKSNQSPRMLNSLKFVTLSDYESANQIRKALIHLINITGGNILKDNLFDNKD